MGTMTKRYRIAAAALAAAAALVMLSSSLFILEHAHHDCTGEDCPVCERLFCCAQNLKNLSAAAVTAAVVIAAALVRCAAIGAPVSVCCAPSTPVAWKVKLSD